MLPLKTVFGFSLPLHKHIFPANVREKVGNVFLNLREPLNSLANAGGGDFDEAGVNIGRFLINSTVGIFGLFDPATSLFNLPPEKQTIGDSLMHHGFDSGPYLVLPFIGQSDIRGLVSTIVERSLHPLNNLTESPETYYWLGVEAVDEFSKREAIYNKLYEQSEDPYTYFRNQYLQGTSRDQKFKGQ